MNKPAPFGIALVGARAIATDPRFPLNTAPVVGSIVAPDGNAYSLIPLGVNAAAGQDTDLVAADPDKLIAVFALAMVTGATATDITFNSKPSGSAVPISCLFANAANGGAVLPAIGAPWFVTNKNEKLTVTAGAGSTTGIQLVYAKFPDNAWQWNDATNVLNNDGSPMA